MLPMYSTLTSKKHNDITTVNNRDNVLTDLCNMKNLCVLLSNVVYDQLTL